MEGYTGQVTGPRRSREWDAPRAMTPDASLLVSINVKRYDVGSKKHPLLLLM